MSQIPQSSSPQPSLHISGYLHKKTRDGRWQKRWFESNASFLTYYKSKKMTKLLAALNLPQVGSIERVLSKSGSSSTGGDEEGTDGTFFTIELNLRIYTLKADNVNDCVRWVETLNLLKVEGLNSSNNSNNSSNVNHSNSSNNNNSNNNRTSSNRSNSSNANGANGKLGGIEKIGTREKRGGGGGCCGFCG